MSNSTLTLTVEEIERIAGFLGYGRSSAPVWFVGFEEGLGNMSDDDATKNCETRSRFESIMDLYEAHLGLLQKGLPINLEEKPPRTQVWQFMAKLMLARDGIADWWNMQKVNDYIRFCLGRKGGDTFLTELSPIPTGHTSDNSWMSRFAELDNNLAAKIKRRKEELRRLLKDNSPDLVICYGLGKKGDFAELLDIEWEPVMDRVFAASASRCLLLPFFGNGQMSNSIIACLVSKNLMHL